MKFGLFINAQHPVGESVSQRIAEASEQTRLAREAGFDMICAGQHYLSHPYQMSAIIPLLARLTADAEGMEIAATVLLIPLLNPVDVAETCATLDAMSGGRFVLGIGIGYRDEEYTAFGIQRSERIPRLIEAMDIIRLLWTEDEVEYNGTYYQSSQSPGRHPACTKAPPAHMGSRQRASGHRQGCSLGISLGHQSPRHHRNGLRPA